MNLSIKNFQDAGNLDKERIVLAVERSDDVGNYVIFRTESLGDAGVSSIVKDAFWFPEKKLRAGDFVVLYTKSGTQSEKTVESGATSHFFYWGKTNPLWLKEDAATLLHSSDWAVKAVEQRVASKA